MRADACFGYALAVHDSLIPLANATEDEKARWNALRPDPLNARRAPEPLASLAELPAALPQPWIVSHPGTTAGRIEEHRLRSERLGNERIIRVYTPPGYDPQGPPYGLVVVLDGRTYTSDVPTPMILTTSSRPGASRLSIRDRLRRWFRG
jgi:enterochelin esterase family protein